MVFSLLLGGENKALGTHDLERGRKLTSDPGCTNVCWRKNISAFTVLFYLRLRSVLAGRSRCPREADEFGIVLFLVR